MTRKNLESRYGLTIQILSFLGAMFLLLPVVFVVLYSFNPGAYFKWPPQDLTLKWYHEFFESERFMRATWNSVLVAAIVTPASLIVALPTALALVRGSFPGRALIAALIMSPLIVPGVVTGISLLALFAAMTPGFGIHRLLIGMFIFGLPFAVRSIVANLMSLDIRTEEAARNLGAGPWRTFLNVTLPQLKPGMLSAAILVFVEAIDNFSISVFLSNDKTIVLPVAAYQHIRDFDNPTVAAMATLLILFSCLMIFVIERLIGFDKMMRI